MKARLLSLFFFTIALPVFGAPPHERYLVKLKYLTMQPNATAAAVKSIVHGHGGRVNGEWRDRLYITLPEQAIAAITAHNATLYVQRAFKSTEQVAGTTASYAQARVVRSMSGSPWESGTYEYDGAGNIRKIGTDTFVYDPLSRLVSSNIKSNEETYTYDAFGNLTYKTTKRVGEQNPTPIDLSTDTTSNHLTLRHYDAAGNLDGDDLNGDGIRDPSSAESYEYDALNMPRKRTKPDGTAEFYLYDANDERVAVYECPTDPCEELITFSIRDEQGRVLRQFDVPYQQVSTQMWHWLEDYVYRGDQLLVGERVTALGGRRHFHLDHLGTPRLVTNSTGQRIAEHDYFPFGVEITPLRQEILRGFGREDPAKFTGHQRDFTGGTDSENITYNDYMHARLTTPHWGRFLSPDPLGANPARPQTFNRYSYTYNQPVNFRDATGAYRTDFHHDLTQILALAVGFSPADAASIAAFTEQPDHDFRDPEPFHHGRERGDYHFTSGGRLGELSAAAVSTNHYAIGSYLHALQDAFSHRGYGPMIGHTSPSFSAGNLLNPLAPVVGFFVGAGTLGYGAAYAVDTTSDRPNNAFNAAVSTYQALAKIQGGTPNIGFARLSNLIYGYLGAEDHSILRQFYYKRLCAVVGCTAVNEQRAK